MNSAIPMVGTVKKYINRFIEANATREEDAVDPKDIGCLKITTIKQLETRGVLKATLDGKYYLVEDALESFVSRKRKISFIIASVILVLVIILIGYYM